MMSPTTDLGSFLKGFPVHKLFQLQPYAKLKQGEITPDVIKTILGVFDISLGDSDISELAQEIVKDDPDSLAEWIAKPGNFDRITSKVQRSQDALVDQTQFIRCPHCEGVFLTDTL